MLTVDLSHRGIGAGLGTFRRLKPTPIFPQPPPPPGVETNAPHKTSKPTKTFVQPSTVCKPLTLSPTMGRGGRGRGRHLGGKTGHPMSVSSAAHSQPARMPPSPPGAERKKGRRGRFGRGGLLFAFDTRQRASGRAMCGGVNDQSLVPNVTDGWLTA